MEGVVDLPGPLQPFYRGRAVLITGHTGFKGGWLATWLKMLGARVVGLALPPERDRPSLFEAAEVARDMVSIFGDVRDSASLLDLVRTHAPEIVFHMAAQPLVRRSYRDPVDTYETNVMGTVRVLEAVRAEPSVRAVVVVTSDKCYDNREWVWGYREAEPMGGRDPYSSSKGCAELVTAAYRASFFEKGRTAVASARAGNVIGGGDWAEDRLVPDTVRAIASGAPIVLRRPKAIRPWQHVLEPIRGYLMLAERLCTQGQAFAEPWNFGPRDEDAIPVRQLAEKIVRYWQAGLVAIDENPDVLEEATDLRLDCSKARSRLGWIPLLSLDEAVELTVEWYRAYLKDPAAAPSVMGEQIQDYMERFAT